MVFEHDPNNPVNIGEFEYRIPVKFVSNRDGVGIPTVTFSQDVKP